MSFRLDYEVEIYFDNIVVVPAIPGETVPTQRIRVIDCNAPSQTSFEVVGWASLTGRTLDDQAPIMHVLQWPFISQPGGIASDDVINKSAALIASPHSATMITRPREEAVVNGVVRETARVVNDHINHFGSMQQLEEEHQQQHQQRQQQQRRSVMSSNNQQHQHQSSLPVGDGGRSYQSMQQQQQQPQQHQHQSSLPVDGSRSYQAMFAKPVDNRNLSVNMPIAASKQNVQKHSQNQQQRIATAAQTTLVPRINAHNNNQIKSSSNINSKSHAKAAPPTNATATATATASRTNSIVGNTLLGSARTLPTTRSSQQQQQSSMDSFTKFGSIRNNSSSVAATNVAANAPTVKSIGIHASSSTNGGTGTVMGRMQYSSGSGSLSGSGSGTHMTSTFPASSISMNQRNNSQEMPTHSHAYDSSYSCPVCDQDMTLWDLPARNYHVNQCTTGLDELEATFARK